MLTFGVLGNQRSGVIGALRTELKLRPYACTRWARGYLTPAVARVVLKAGGDPGPLLKGRRLPHPAVACPLS